MLKLALFVVVFVICCSAWNKEYTTKEFELLDHKATFKEWAKFFERKYTNLDEEVHRFGIWLDSLKKIAEINSENRLYKLRMNQFGDLNAEEFKIYVHGHNQSCLNVPKDSYYKPSNDDKYVKNDLKTVSGPSSLNWTAQGVVTPVKNQGSCGSCWAFSTTGSLECQYAITHRELNSLSEQQLVDCSRSYGNYGCSGGWWYNAFRYIIDNGGLCSEAEYPYKGVDGVCEATKCGTKYNAFSVYANVTANNEQSLLSAVQNGCVSVGVEADQLSFQYYSSGVLTGPCGTSIDHGVLIAGYGTLGSTDYWQVKNSWGTTWGQNGYALICRSCGDNGTKGQCGINMYPAYPVTS